ncbi:Uncharacterized protein conserved in archaea [Archaeoglobus sulfaticallidus PM70-1]|uniref:UPF0216 protein Asulf_01837 n=1 Tax=Archaeoglobus sulfaticallidus PM70-1 TaxID=387631 RepID=N0BHL7_9EURY|nr:DUF61 family protein [Archaeoglobus sulfaticallidus]AGK61807.1 Uncharacterized protein conserved in archaea [Archaeoglobus sulfaticallidus PM70-1]
MMSERALAKMIEAMNKHMPARRKTLKEMLNEDEPSIKARDGNEYIIEKDELKFISEYVDELDWDKFNIPIILEMNDLHGETVVFIRDKLHQEFMRKAFGFDRYVRDVMMIYLYEMRKVRRALRTASQVVFKVSFR